MAFLSELKHWRVYRLAVSYAAVAWLILQLAVAVREPLGLPTWTLAAVIGVLISGFSVALWVGWMQDHRTVLPDGRTVPRSRKHHLAVVVVALAPSVLVAIGFYAAHRRSAANDKTISPDGPVAVLEKSIAVLPFESLSGDQDNAYFAEGIQDEILTDLAKVADLKVISRTSVMPYRGGAARNLREIGRMLGVSHLLEGSVQRVAGRVRVTAQLIDARTDLHLWAEHYDGDLADIFGIQSCMAELIVQSLRVRISPEEKRAIDTRPTSDLEAYDLYLQAKELLNDFQSLEDYREPLLRSVRLLNAARAKDPNFALAACLLAKAHDQLYWLNVDHTPTRLALQESAVSDALRLQPGLGEAHLARAMYLYHGSFDYVGARRELTIARRTLPNSAEVAAVTGYFDRRQGRWPDAVRNQKAAVSLDPRNSSFLNDLIVVYDVLRLYREEERVAEAGETAVPQEAKFFRLMKAEINLEAGRIDACRRTLATLPDDFDPSGSVTYTRVLAATYERKFAEAAGLLAASKQPTLLDLGGLNLPRAWVEGLLYRATGEDEKAHASMLAAREAVEAGVRGQGEDAATLSLLGKIDAALGRADDARREGRRSVELRPTATDAMSGPAGESALALIEAWSGDADRALEALGPLSKLPGGPHYGELRYDPVWDTVRAKPDFARIVAAMEPQ